ncbi:MAG: tRNA (adenosine(37)-N6)-threonylcarbamoyltransferase complex ATPase subunit type 1 TsaE [Minisyncoccales bacterium]|jgi:tRNA threonylcarbamoyladenosine biosynthesis protein TsaE
MENKRQKYRVLSPAQTKKTGRLLAKEILRAGTRGAARVLALSGRLGAGKTNFVQGFARGLGVKETVASPTFAIIKKYALPPVSGFKNFYHIDCYRLVSGRELAVLGAGKIFGDPANIVAIEWPQIAAGILPPAVIAVNFEIVGERIRDIEFKF